MNNIESVLKKLKSITWMWAKSDIEEILCSLGATLVEMISGRWTCRLSEGASLSVYFQDDRVEFVEITIAVFQNPHLLSEVEYEDKVDEFFEKFEETVLLGKRVLGLPLFNDGAAAEGFPDDQDAVWLALWNVKNARLMIQQTHEDKELPFRLCIVIAPLAC